MKSSSGPEKSSRRDEQAIDAEPRDAVWYRQRAPAEQCERARERSGGARQIEDAAQARREREQERPTTSS
jgi:hypothetical protein